jgi:hypothetical protein
MGFLVVNKHSLNKHCSGKGKLFFVHEQLKTVDVCSPDRSETKEKQLLAG